MLTEIQREDLSSRGGDSFILTPLYCGSNATGWRSTSRYMGDEADRADGDGDLQAANPWTAAGSGVTRPLVGMLMALMDLRLGFWVPANDDYRSGYGDVQASFRANHFEPGIREVGVSLREKGAGLPAQRRRAFREPGAVQSAVGSV